MALGIVSSKCFGNGIEICSAPDDTWHPLRLSCCAEPREDDCEDYALQGQISCTSEWTTAPSRSELREFSVSLHDSAPPQLVTSVLCPAEAGRAMDDHQDAARGSGRHAEGLPALRALAEFTPGPLARSCA